MGGCGLDGYFGEQGLPAGIQECLERGPEGERDEIGGVTDGKVLAYGGVEVQLPIFGPASAAV